MEYDNRMILIMDCAQKLFVARGIKGTTMSDVAAAASLGKPVIYQSFASKDEIVEAVIDRQIEKLANSLQQGIKEEDNPLIKLAKLWNNSIIFYEQDDFLLHILKNNAIGLPPYLHERVVMVIETYVVTLLERIYQEAIDKNLFVDCNSRMAAYISYRVYQAGTYNRSDTIKDYSTREILRKVIEVFSVGLINPKSADLAEILAKIPPLLTDTDT